jgi:hypothetical protein
VVYNYIIKSKGDATMKIIKNYQDFNFRRYSNPWVAIVNPSTAKIDFSAKVGGYTGGYNKGEAGSLYTTNPQDGAVYAYGQKDYRGNNTEVSYAKYTAGEFHPIEKTDLIAALQ